MCKATPAATPLILQRFPVNQSYSSFSCFFLHANYYRVTYSEALQKGEIRLKEWKCVQIGHHKNVAKAIEKYQKEGWRLHTYQATGQATLVSHYLLFEKGE